MKIFKSVDDYISNSNQWEKSLIELRQIILSTELTKLLNGVLQFIHIKIKTLLELERSKILFQCGFIMVCF